MSPRNHASSKTRRPLPDEIKDALSSVPSAETEPESIDAPAAVATIDPPKKEPAKPEPPPKKTKPPTTSDLVTEEVMKQRRLAESCEELAFVRHALLADGQDLSPDQFRLYQTAVPRRPNEDRALWGRDWDRHLRKEDSRIEQVLSLQAAAGTTADQVKADKLVKDADAKRDKESPAIESEIRKLQAEWESLHQAATNAKSAADDRHIAVAALRDRKLLPGFVLDELNANHHRDTRSFGKDLLQLETRQTTIRGILALDVESPTGLAVAKNHVGGNSKFGADEFARRDFMFHTESWRDGINTHHKTGGLQQNKWVEYLAELREELTGVENKIATIISGEQADADKEIESLRSHYLPV